MTSGTFPRPVLSERQRDMLQSLGLGHEVTSLAIIITHPDATISRVDAADMDVWIAAYALGRSARGRA